MPALVVTLAPARPPTTIASPYPRKAPTRPKIVRTPATIVMVTGLNLVMRTISPISMPITYVKENGIVKFQPVYVSPLILAQGT